MIRNLAAAGAGKGSALLEQREEIRTVAFVVVAGDRGLCGGYNTNVIRAAEREMARLRAEGKQTRLITVGKKATAYFRFRGYELDDSHVGFSDEPTYEDARRVAESVVQRFEDGEYDAVEIAYTQFISAGVQRVQLKRFVPAGDRPARRRREVRRPVGRLRVRAGPRARSSTACSLATPRPASTPRCSRARRRSSPPSSAP